MGLAVLRDVTGVLARRLRKAEVPVLRAAMRPGEVIHERDIEWMSVQANRLTRTSVTDTESLVGMTPRRPIRPC